MPAHRKHVSRCFTTGDLRALNLDLVTDVRILRQGRNITGARVYRHAADGSDVPFMALSPIDAIRLFDLLF